MSPPQLARERESQTTGTATQREESGPPQIDAAELLDLLGDEYTREVLQTLASEPRTGREIVATADASKATVYRRLDRLSEAGLIESSTKLDPDGHHREQFWITFEGASCTVSEDGIEAQLRVPDESNATSTTGTDGETEQTATRPEEPPHPRRNETPLLQK